MIADSDPRCNFQLNMEWIVATFNHSAQHRRHFNGDSGNLQLPMQLVTDSHSNNGNKQLPAQLIRIHTVISGGIKI